MAAVVGSRTEELPSTQVERASRELVRDARALAFTVRTTWGELETGAQRASVMMPGYLRLARWKLSRRLKVRTLWGVLPLLAALGVVACDLVPSDTGEGLRPILAPPPDLSKSKKAEPETPAAPWAYVLPVDHGVRADESGEGSFRAPRFHGEHNGIDLLAPVGTPTFAACTGQVMTGVSGSFGRWAHVICPVPEALIKKGGPTPWVSFFYAHLERLDFEQDKWLDVNAGAQLGTVGKTGNARGPNVQPHLHLELIVQTNRRSAMDERHLGRDQSSVAAAEHFAAALEDTCLEPLGLMPKSKQVARARRVDPFLALVCLTPEKPRFAKAPSPLESASLAWSELYLARDFNVNGTARR